MKIKRHISIIIATILMFFVSINSIPASAVEDATTTEIPTIEASSKDGDNFVHLNWTSPNKDKYYSYKLYSKEKSEPIFQSIPSKKNVKVLNVYPSKGDNLKDWMETNGFGKNLISVDKVDIDVFNKEASTYLKDNGKWKYDVIMFGSWDSNNSKDISADAALVVEEFVKAGRGVLFGHDTIKSDTPSWNFNKTFVKYLNMDINADYWGGKLAYGRSTNVKINKKGLLTNYPWAIGEVGSTLKIPLAHNVGQLAHGDIWLKFDNTDDSCPANSYLTTWNNVAMIQTGHSSGAATEDEQKILANTLFYLAQITEETSWDDHKGQDLAKPTKPNVTAVNYKDKKVTVKFDESKDMGSTYDYYVEAIEKGSGNKTTSKTTTQTVTTGLKGYAVVVDQNENTIPDAAKDLKKDIKNGTYTVDGNFNGDFYVHVVAVDNAGKEDDKGNVERLGNVSEVATYKYSFPTVTLSEGEVDKDTNTVKITAQGKSTQSSVTSMVLPDGTTVESDNCEYTVKANGTYEFSAVDKEGNKVTQSIKINNLSTDINFWVDYLKDNFNYPILGWRISDDTQDYTYNVNGKKSTESEYTPKSEKEQSYQAFNDTDLEAPTKSDITNVNVDRANNKTKIKFNESVDKGTSYDYFVEAIASETGIKSTSETKSINILSGIKGYSVVVDKNADTVPDGTITTTSTDYTFDKALDGEFYVHVVAVDNAGNKSEVSTYRYAYPTLTLTPSTTKVVKDSVTITADATKSVNKVVTIITPDGKEVSADKVEYTVDVNGKYTFTAVDEDGNKTTETIVIDKVVPDVILDAESNMNKTHLDEEFVVDLTINNIKSIFATEVRIKYDSTKLELLGLDKVNGIEVVNADKTEGEVTLALASLGVQNPMAGKTTLIKMKFKGTNPGDAKIDVVKGAVANGLDKETNLRDAECGETTVNVCDRKLKDAYTLLDLSIIAKHYGEDPKALLESGIDADLNLDGNIDVADYQKCYQLMLKNPNHKF